MSYDFRLPHLTCSVPSVWAPVTFDDASVTITVYSSCAETVRRVFQNPREAAKRIHQQLSKALDAEEYNEMVRRWARKKA